MSDAPPAAPPSRLKVALTVLFHSTCAISVTLISKSALNGISLPITLLFGQTLVQVLLLSLLGRPLGWIRFRRPTAAWRALVPLAAARLVGVLAKTLCLAAVNASFYQIARGLLLPFSLLLSTLFLRPRPVNPPLSLGGCALVMCGFATGVVTDLQKMLTSYVGLALGVGSSFTTAVESVVVKRFVSKGDEGMWQLVWMSSTMQLALYIPLMLFSGEWAQLQTLRLASQLHAGLEGAVDPAILPQFAKTVFLTGIASFLLTLATFLQISVTSPTTHMIVTAARGVAQSALAVVIFGERVTAGRVWSIVFILTGSTVYGWSKDRLRKEQEKKVAGGAYAPVPGAEREGDVEMGEKGRA
ncbi:hypothetical protein EDC01DRAFT_679404 [Geopyxis carbonaria]|nr:hypothetical protein EDC01DRAFT_679404 [Geopyxis carbonaria]